MNKHHTPAYFELGVMDAERKHDWLPWVLLAGLFSLRARR